MTTSNRLRFHVSVLMRKEQVRSSKFKSGEMGDLRDLIVFTSQKRNGEEVLLISDSTLKKLGGLFDLNTMSYLEKCFFNTQSREMVAGENLSFLSPSDLLGVDTQWVTGASIVNQQSKSSDLQYSIYCFCLKLSSHSPGFDAVIRLILQEDIVKSSDHDMTTLIQDSEKQFLRSQMILAAEKYSIFSEVLLHSVESYRDLERNIANKESLHQQDQEVVENVKSMFSRYRKLYKVVCRESSLLLDPPIIGSDNMPPRTSHPANILPISALQDSCLKLLTLVRTLLRTEGQALLLKDPTTSPPTYQLIYSGNALSWPSIEPNAFGIITSRESKEGNLRLSLVETVVNTRKSLVIANGPLDEKYNSHIDGICSLGTPLLICPLRGRSGGIIGAMIAAKGRDSLPFSMEDIAAGELIVSMGALSIYWCQGMGSLHHQLHKTMDKLEKIEKSITQS